MRAEVSSTTESEAPVSPAVARWAALVGYSRGHPILRRRLKVSVVEESVVISRGKSLH